MGRVTETAEDKKWRAECDARTLIEAEAIKVDKGRKKAAVTQAKQMVTDAKNQARATEKVAKVKITVKPKKPTRKVGRKPTNRKKK